MPDLSVFRSKACEVIVHITVGMSATEVIVHTNSVMDDDLTRLGPGG